MAGQQKYRSPERSGEQESDHEIPVVEPEVPAEVTDELLEEIDELVDDEGLAPLDPKDLDTLLGEIDALLEPNAVEFVQKFQQRGGQ